MALGQPILISIKSLIDTGQHQIPDYQRDYSWEKDNQIKVFWEDILSLINSQGLEHFLGQMVVHSDVKNNKNYIIDGQQRTTTIFLLLIAIRNLLNNTVTGIPNLPANAQIISDYNEFLSEVKSLIGGSGRRGGASSQCKLVLGKEYKDYFNDKVVNNSHEGIEKLSGKRIGEKRLISGYKFLYDLLNKYSIQDGDEKDYNAIYDRINEIYTPLIDKMKIVYITTEEESEAFLIFETLNARGRELATSDLLKNYLFRQSKTEIDKVKNYWSSMDKTLGAENLTSFIRCIWNSKYEFTREKYLYRKLGEKIKTPKAALDFSILLSDMSEKYKCLLEPDTITTVFQDSKESNKFKYTINILNDFKLKTYQPVLMSYMLEYGYKSETELLTDMNSLAEAIEKLVVRDIVIGKKSPAGYEIVFANLAEKISNHQITDIADMISELKEASMNEKTFKDLFVNFSIEDSNTGKNKIRYLFRKMIAKDNPGEIQLLSDNTKVHIEHIMPVDNSIWKVDEDIHKEYLWRLGNLTLLLDKLNESIKNNLFDVKKTKYNESAIVMNKKLCNLSSWDKNAIEARQSDLYEIAKELWSFE